MLIFPRGAALPAKDTVITHNRGQTRAQMI
jgi:hypothetical protein